MVYMLTISDTLKKLLMYMSKRNKNNFNLNLSDQWHLPFWLRVPPRPGPEVCANQQDNNGDVEDHNYLGGRERERAF